MVNEHDLDLDLDSVLDEEFDPLADSGFDDEDDDDVLLGPSGDAAGNEPHVAPVPEHDPRPARERIIELFEGMQARRKTLMAIITHCEEAKPVFDVVDYIGVLKEHDHSVYSANDFCSLLERAGAIERVGEDGSLYEDVELEPKVVVEDGVEYLEPNTPPPAFWRATSDGLAFAKADSPTAHIQKIFEEESLYLPIYKQILTLCAREDGASAREMAKLIDNDPLLKSPRYYSSRFVEKLNLAGALEWGDKVWNITEAGLEALDTLSAV